MTSNVNPNSQFAQNLALLNTRPVGNVKKADDVAQERLSTVPEECTAGPMKGAKGKAKKAKKEPVAKLSKERPNAKSKDLFGDDFSVEDLFPRTVTPEKGPLTKTSEKVAVTAAIAGPHAGSWVEIVKPKHHQIGIECSPVKQPEVEEAPIQKEETVENTNKMRKRLFILGLILLIGGVVGIGLMTNFKFDQIKLKDWHWDALTAAGAGGIVLVIYAIFKRCKKVMVSKEPEIDPRREKKSEYLGWDKLYKGGHLNITGKGAKNPLPMPRDKLLPVGKGVNAGQAA